MYTVIRNYPSAPTLANDLTQRRAEIEALISGIPGFVSYYLIKTDHGATSVTVCADRAGCDASTQKAGEWIKQNLPDLKLAAPQIFAGEIAITFSGAKTVSA